jgi:GTP cyclohydrolase II
MLNWPAEQSDRIATERAVTEVQAGRPVIIDGDTPVLAHPVDPLAQTDLDALCAAGAHLSLSSTRAAALGLAAEPLVLSLPARTSVATVKALACDGGDARNLPPQRAGAAARAAVTIAKLARQVPAMLLVPEAALPALPQLVRVSATAVERHAGTLDKSLRLVSRARVPLKDAGPCEFVVFRGPFERTSSAVIVGSPDLTKPVPVRLHSSCLTGDAFGSMRCDCGDQLRMALSAMKPTGGILLYLDQEGCGIGLANKMRAYRLQDMGLDTVEANRALGFANDERQYDGAAAMLSALGVGEVLLLTNNPAKMAALTSSGIRIAGRLPLLAPVHGDNRRYLETKARKAGHLLERTTEALLT